MVWLCSRFCLQPWDGSQLILGTMYSYDIFAAVPCCAERLKVSHAILTLASASLFSSSVLRKRSLPLRSFADWSQNLTFSRLRLLYSDGKTVALGTVFVNIFDNLNYVWAHIEIFIEYTKNKNVFLLNCFGGIFILIFRKVVTFNVYGL